METKEQLHFTIGEGFCDILIDVAQETLLYKKNLPQAIKVIKDSLIGISEEQAVFVLFGVVTIKEDVPTQTIEMELKTSKKQLLFEFIPNKLIEHEKNLMGMGAFLKLEVQKVSNRPVYFDSNSLVNYFNNDDTEEILENIEEEFVDFAGITKGAKLYIEEVKEELQLWKDIHDKAEEFNIPINITLEQCAPSLWQEELEFILKNSETFEAPDVETTQLDEYMDTIKQIDIISDKGIAPVDIMDNYSAGWLSPEGDYYGMNGTIANMLHNELADLMVEEGIIPKDFDGEINETVWLERHGWVKQHGDWILYGGYENSQVGEKDVPITKKQIDILYEFGQRCHKGRLKLGFKMQYVSAVTLPQIDPLMFKLKWFNL